MSNTSKSDENWKMYKEGDGDVVEGFCGACLAIPFAFAGIGMGAYGANTRKKHKHGKKMAFWGFLIGFISLIVTLYFFFTCSTCR
jgi:hypothetical protein